MKAKLHEMMQQDREFSPDDYESLNPCHQISISKALAFIRNPVQCCRHIHALIHSLLEDIERLRQQLDDSGALVETALIVLEVTHVCRSLQHSITERLGS